MELTAKPNAVILGVSGAGYNLLMLEKNLGLNDYYYHNSRKMAKASVG